jgi:hypothetical protein
MRAPLSKQRNKPIQRVLVETAKLAPREGHKMALVYAIEKQKGNPNRATLAVVSENGGVSAGSGSRKAELRAGRRAHLLPRRIKLFATPSARIYRHMSVSVACRQLDRAPDREHGRRIISKRIFKNV